MSNKLPDWLQHNLLQNCPVCGQPLELTPDLQNRKCSYYCKGNNVLKVKYALDKLGLDTIDKRIIEDELKYQFGDDPYKYLAYLLKDKKLTPAQYCGMFNIKGLDSGWTSILKAHGDDILRMFKEYSGTHCEKMKEIQADVLLHMRDFNIQKAESREHRIHRVPIMISGSLLPFVPTEGEYTKAMFVLTVESVFPTVDLARWQGKRASDVEFVISDMFDGTNHTEKTRIASRRGIPVVSSKEFVKILAERGIPTC